MAGLSISIGRHNSMLSEMELLETAYVFRSKIKRPIWILQGYGYPRRILVRKSWPSFLESPHLGFPASNGNVGWSIHEMVRESSELPAPNVFHKPSKKPCVDSEV